ncbi:uncharacterized protein RHOBADRAFT_66871 [Rhodotorula graminis WP1]|uniref:Uncharacterized protein n=1 Tax=Rhodotorula graminis (strain WP1) TaxID=578459 RepID=A0A0P9ITS0_RHOGW|nr:uncharacterized protein RHOBADRAFT_66871 [Rhodotorula graminis WP1]KPV72817.1 hypothetical protein RHOBADRAFT_66871 [Rhodotorula graminis WP1]
MTRGPRRALPTFPSRPTGPRTRDGGRPLLSSRVAALPRPSPHSSLASSLVSGVVALRIVHTPVPTL